MQGDHNTFLPHTRTVIFRCSAGLERFQRKFRQDRIMATPKPVFVLNPYDQELDLSKREHLKLYTDGCVGLSEKSKFDEKRENYSSFVKLIGKKMERFRTKTCLKIATEWEASDTSPELVTEKGIVDLFSSNAATTEEVEARYAAVWSVKDLVHTESKNLFVRTTSKPGDILAIDSLRKRYKLKHAMLGLMIWDSLTSDFQLDIIGNEEDFNRGEEYDGVAVCHYTRNQSNPSTTTGASAFKDDIESKKIADFGDDTKAYHT